MTESEWATATDPFPMLTFLEARGPVSRRKLRLFALAACRRWWHLLTDPRSRAAVEVAEHHIDGLADEATWDRAGLEARRAVTDAEGPGEMLPGMRWKAAWAAWIACAPPGRPSPADHRTFVSVTASAPGSGLDPAEEPVAHAAALRDLFGNPFKPVAFDPGWRTEAVVALARGIYEERAFERMPVLGDALEDAGCGDKEVLEHCRGQNVHVRGCWVVDAVLGKP